MASLRLNDHGPEVRKLQLLLNSLVFPRPKLGIDGDFGLRTLEALLAFQRSHGLEPDGVAGPKTREALGLKAEPGVIAKVSATVSPWLDIAVAELGVHEDSVQGAHTARIVEYHQTTTLRATDDETPWCSSFVNWVMRQSGRAGTNSALARSWLNWGTAVTDPSPGAVVVIKKTTPGTTRATGSTTGFHVGFYITKSQSYVRILGGNQSDQVKYSNFMLSAYEVKGYRVPN